MNSFVSKVILGFSLIFTAVFPVVATENMPFQTVTPYSQADTRKIIVFMKYDCPYCRQYHPSLAYWAKNIPPGYSIEFSPVLEQGADGKITQDTMVPFVIYQGLESAGATNDQLMSFSEAAYAIEQDTHTINDKSAWIKAGDLSGVAPKTIAKGLQTAKISFSGVAARQEHYHPVATPTIVVCGKYMFTPDNAGGIPAEFLQLLNGTLSKCLSEQGSAPKL